MKDVVGRAWEGAHKSNEKGSDTERRRTLLERGIGVKTLKKQYELKGR